MSNSEFPKKYVSTDCLYNTPTDCTLITQSQSNRSLAEIVKKYDDIVSLGFCSKENQIDGSNCYYAIQDLSNAYNLVYPTYKTSTNELKIKRSELNKSVNEYEKQVATEAAFKNPIQELYDSSIYTNTLWAVLGTTMLFYVFHKMTKSE